MHTVLMLLAELFSGKERKKQKHIKIINKAERFFFPLESKIESEGVPSLTTPPPATSATPTKGTAKVNVVERHSPSSKELTEDNCRV